jgi:hypothetical protein
MRNNNTTEGAEMKKNEITWNTIHGMKVQSGSVASVNGWRFHRIIKRFATIDSEATYSVAVYAPRAAECDEIWAGMTAKDIDAAILARTK